MISEGLLPEDGICGRGHCTDHLTWMHAFSVNESQIFVEYTVGIIDKFCSFKHIPKKKLYIFMQHCDKISDKVMK